MVQRLFKRASVVVVVLSGRVGLELELGALLVLAKCCAIAFGCLVINQQAWLFFEARVRFNMACSEGARHAEQF